MQIGVSLSKGGPGKLLLDIYAPAVKCFLILNLGSLFFAFTLWCIFILAVNNCLCEIHADPRSNAQIDALSSGNGLVDPYIFTICTQFCSFFRSSTQSTLQVRFADRFVDPAFGFCAGVNYFVFEAALIPFEVTAFNVVIQFWTDEIPVAAVICFVLLFYRYV